MTTTPRRIEYSGPTDLITLVIEVREQFETGAIPVPAPPTPEERRHMFGEQRERYEAKRAARAVYRALAPTATDQPF